MEIAKGIITNNKNVLAPCLPGVWRRQRSADTDVSRQPRSYPACPDSTCLFFPPSFFPKRPFFCETLSSLSASTFITNGTLSSSPFLVRVPMTAKWEDCDMRWFFDGHGNESGRMSPESLPRIGHSSILQCWLVGISVIEVRLDFIFFSLTIRAWFHRPHL